MTGITVTLRRRLRLAAGLLALAALVSGCTRFGGEEEEAEEAAAVPVDVVQAALATMTQTLTVTGTIRAMRSADIAPQLSAEVREVKVREGDVVRAGQPLITLDRVHAESQARQARAGVEAARARLQAARSRLAVFEQGAREEERAIARSRLEQTRSALEQARADLERMRGLFEKGAVSRQQLDAAQVAYDTARTNRDSAQQSLELTEKGAREEEIDGARKEVDAAAAALEQVKAALAQAEQQLGYTVIRAPFDGVVHARNIEPGEIASPGGMAPLLRLADPSSVYFEARVPERVALRVRAGQRVQVIVQGNGDRPVEGHVERVVPVADPASREFLVRIDVEDGNSATKPGMFARGSVIVSEHPDAVVLPKEALIEREGRPTVFVVEAGKARARPVTVGITDATRAEIVSGVEPGEGVVVAGAGQLMDGAAVQTREAEG